MLDLPALGKPTRPTSASSRSSSRRRRCCPGSPRSLKCATRLPADREALPRPPRPPLAATKRAPGVARSASRRPSSSRTMVPTGTGRRRSAPSEPLRLLPWPWVPLRARWCGWKWYSTRVATLGTHGQGNNRKGSDGADRLLPVPVLLTVERGDPVAPATCRHLESGLVYEHRPPAPRPGDGLLALLYAGELAAADLVVDDPAGDLGEQGVVAATADAG